MVSANVAARGFSQNVGRPRASASRMSVACASVPAGDHDRVGEIDRLRDADGGRAMFRGGLGGARRVRIGDQQLCDVRVGRQQLGVPPSHPSDTEQPDPHRDRVRSRTRVRRVSRHLGHTSLEAGSEPADDPRDPSRVAAAADPAHASVRRGASHAVWRRVLP
jgi:hypothetical protein